VPVNGTVTWTWSTCSGGDPYTGTGQTCVAHDVTWDVAGTPASARQDRGTYQRPFPSAGTFAYHCSIHGTAMSGTIVVR
jgi:plastocyanin